MRGFWIILTGGLVYLLFARNIAPGTVSTLVLRSVGGKPLFIVPDLVLPSFVSIVVLSAIVLMVGVSHLFVPRLAQSKRAIWAVVGLTLAAFVLWATKGQSMNVTGLLRLTIVQAVPILLGAFSGLICERSGVINMAIEGEMLTGALVSVMVSSATGSLLAGLVAGMVAGGLLAWVHAVLSIRYQVNQIVSSMVINIFAAGITSFISIRFLLQNAHLNMAGIFPDTKLPVISRLPIVGPILFNQNIFLYIAVALLFLLNGLLFRTRWGLRTRLVGEHPEAADTLGIDVRRHRYVAVVLGGMIAGLAGVSLTLGSVGRFDRLMTSGRGYIGLAAMIFGNWRPFGALGASLLFGFSSTLQSKLSILQVPIPSQFLLMAPYVATMVVLAGVVGKVTAPAADGQPYEGRK